MSYQQIPNSREAPYNNRAASAMYSQAVPSARPQQVSQSQAILYAQGAAQAAQADNSMASMMNSFSQTHLTVPGAAMQAPATTVPVGTNQYFYTADGQLVYAPPASIYAQAMAPTQLADGSYGSYPATLQYLPQATYPGYIQGFPMVPYTPGRSSYYSDRSDIGQKGVPGLENRRGSYSTDESAPGTPYYGSMSLRDHGAHIAAVDRSPIYSTPSPQLNNHHMLQHLPKPLPYKNVITLNVDIDSLIQQHPAIPHAVPAVFTPRENMRTLEQSLSNPIFGNRNVYIRGLHPNTNDDTLAAYAGRFGQIETSKAIIDTATGACKGFGFAKYYDVRDSELCIRGFYKLGYEVGFARESFNSRLKAEGDETSTNLYVSNLPRDMTEGELGAIFMDYTVSSSRILRDGQGHSRGVGFARFESREICEEVIKRFHGQPIGSEGLLLQVRYADTPAQKDLKKITTERRQFRTNEYNVGAYGDHTAIPLSPVLQSPILPVLPRMAQIVRHLPQSRVAGSWKRDMSGPIIAGSAIGAPTQIIHKPSVKFSDMYVNAMDAKDMQPKVSTPTVSEDGSGDEGATIHGVTPTAARGVSVTSSPSRKA